MALLTQEGNINWGIVLSIAQILGLVCAMTYVFAVTDARSTTNEESIKELKKDTNQELRYIRNRIDFLIELQLKEKQ